MAKSIQHGTDAEKVSFHAAVTQQRNYGTADTGSISAPKRPSRTANIAAKLKATLTRAKGHKALEGTVTTVTKGSMFAKAPEQQAQEPQADSAPTNGK